MALSSWQIWDWKDVGFFFAVQPFRLSLFIWKYRLQHKYSILYVCLSLYVHVCG